MKKFDRDAYLKTMQLVKEVKEHNEQHRRFNNINQDADESAPDQDVRKDEPLVKEPEKTDGAGGNPGVPAGMKNKEPKNESEFVQRLKTLSGQN